MLPRNHPDRIEITFDDRRVVANAGLLLPATLALRLGLPQLLRKHLDRGGAPGRANTGDKMMTLVASALAADALRTGGTARVLGFTAKAPSTSGWGASGIKFPSVLHSGIIWFHLANQMNGESQLPVSRTNRYSIRQASPSPRSLTPPQR